MVATLIGTAGAVLFVVFVVVAAASWVVGQASLATLDEDGLGDDEV